MFSDTITVGSYYIDTPESFRDQDVEHERADEMSASTQYWVTSAFYLHWISPDQVIYEGEEAYVGCESRGHSRSRRLRKPGPHAGSHTPQEARGRGGG